MTDLTMGYVGDEADERPIWANLPFLERGIPAGAQHLSDTKDVSKMSQKELI